MRRLFGPILALFVALTPSCLGGQTGQPSSGSCDLRPLPVAETWRGRTAQELAAAFEGTHHATLDWMEEDTPAADTTAVPFDDAISISISATTVAGVVDSCVGTLDIPVQLEISTTESGLGESGIAVLTFSELAPVLSAHLSFDGTKLSVEAQLTQTDAALAPHGWLVPRVAGTPGGSASLR